MKRIAITGGRGRLAPLAASFLNAAGHEVTLFSRKGEGKIQPLSLLANPDLLRTFDVLVHSAWSTVPFSAEEAPESTDKHDLPLIGSLLEAASLAGVHFVFFSTAAVYGNTGPDPAVETQPLAPLGRYALGKIAAEDLLLQSGLPVTILRATNLMGELPDFTRPQGILPRLIQAVRTGAEVTVWGDGTATKDYLHCGDFLAAVAGIVESGTTGVFNVSSGCSVSLLELVAMVEQAAGQRVKVKHAAHFPWDVSHSRIDSTRLKGAINWKPLYSLPGAVSECLSHFP